MKKIPNTQKISSISFQRNVQPFCPLGGDYYTAEVDVDFIPGESYMDYIEMDEAIQELGGLHLTIEDLAARVYDMLTKFKPEYLCVTISADSNKHFPVVVTKESEEF